MKWMYKIALGMIFLLASCSGYHDGYEIGEYELKNDEKIDTVLMKTPLNPYFKNKNNTIFCYSPSGFGVHRVYIDDVEYCGLQNVKCLKKLRVLETHSAWN